MNELAKSNEGQNDADAAHASPFSETPDIHSSSDEYAGRFAGRAGDWMLSVQEKITLDYLGASGAKTVLDVGGGHGQLARPLVRDGFEVTVLGSAESCAHRISDLVGQGRCRFVVGNLIGLPYADQSFDVVICFRIVMHCEQWPKLVSELCRVAKKMVILDYPTSQGINGIAPALFDAKKKLEGNTRLWRSFRHAEITGEFANNGFRLAQRTGQFFLPMALHRALGIKPLSAAAESVTRALGLNRRWGSPVIAEFMR